jgi:anti-sigma B factor antagonist
MTGRKRPVDIMQLPERLGKKEARNFAREVNRCMNITRPYLVIDCSRVRQLDKTAAHLLLCCLEEAMKRNGEVKLVGAPPTTDGAFEPVAMNRLFEIFDTTADAVNSFYRFSLDDASEMGNSESAA